MLIVATTYCSTFRWTLAEVSVVAIIQKYCVSLICLPWQENTKELDTLKGGNQEAGTESDASLGSDGSNLASSRSSTTWVNLAAQDSDIPVTSDDELRLRIDSSSSTDLLAGSPSGFSAADGASATPTGEIDVEMGPVGGVIDARLYHKRGVEDTKDDAARAIVVGGGRKGDRVGGESEGKDTSNIETEDIPGCLQSTTPMDRLVAKGDAGVLKDNVLANLCAIAEDVERKLGSTRSCRGPTPADKGNIESGSDFARAGVSTGRLYHGDEGGESAGNEQDSSLSHLDSIGSTHDGSQTDHETNVLYTSYESSERTPPRSPPQPRTNTTVAARPHTTTAPDAMSHPISGQHSTISDSSAPASPTSHTPSTINASILPRTEIQGVDFRASEASIGSDGSTSGGAGWGLFCSSPVKRGGTVFQEKALLTVSPHNVDGADWRIIVAAAKQVHFCC